MLATMGGRLSRARGNNENEPNQQVAQDAVSGNEEPAPVNPAHPERTAEQQAQVTASKHDFNVCALRLFRRKLNSSNTPRIEIKGKAESYPFWMSSQSLITQQTGDSSDQVMEYLEMRRDKSCVSTVPQIPQFLLDRVNKTLKMSLKYRSTSLNEAKQTQLPEHGILRRTVDKLYIHIGVLSSPTSPLEEPRRLDIRVYEHHRTNAKRRKSLLRPMKVCKILYGIQHNMALIGNDFCLIIRRTIEVVNGQMTEELEGKYSRSLDTSPTGTLTFDLHSPILVDDLILPLSVTHTEEYAKRLLSKQNKKNYKVKVPKMRRTSFR